MVHRRTSQRDAIRAVFRRADRPLGPEEVLERAREEVSTLLRMYDVDEGEIRIDDQNLREVTLPGESTRYEAASLPHHHHFLCRGCRRAFDVPDCPGRVEALAPEGFVAESHEVILYGLCPECA